MILAELHGKIGSESRLDERREDVLTSNVFGLLRYVPQRLGLFEFLRRARKVRLRGDEAVAEHDPNWDPLQGVTECGLTFWLRRREYGEPDVCIEGRDAAGSLAVAILLEAKYLSGKSGKAAEEDTFDPLVPDPDQLARYWQLLLAMVPTPTSRLIIYLTAHSTPPLDELWKSMIRVPEAQFAWLSWHDAWVVAHRLSRDHLAMRDLESLLTYKGLKPFTGFSAPLIDGFPAARMFTALLGWFTGSTPTTLPRGPLWRRA